MKVSRHHRIIPYRVAFCAVVLLLIGKLQAAPLRVATFNIFEGLGAPGSASFEETAFALARINADVVALQEINHLDQRIYVEYLGQRLDLPHLIYEQPGLREMRVALLSRHPIASDHRRIYADGMSRPIVLARIEVPEAERPPWIAVLHLKCCDDSPTDHHRRAVELYHLRQSLLAHADLTNDPVILLGDFNLVVDDDRTYYQALYAGVTYPLSAPADADGYFVAEGIFKLDARHAGGGGENWTWMSNGRFPSRDLDHVMVNARVRSRGTAAEVYDISKDAAGVTGLRKYGAPPPAGSQYGSDHLPVFADLDVGTGPLPPNLVVNETGSPVPEGPRGGPFVPLLAKAYMLENAGSSTLAWSAECDAPWLELSTPSGTLPAGATVAIEARLTAEAALLPAGKHTARVIFRNTTTGFGNAALQTSMVVGAFVMDGAPDAPGYTLDGRGITLRAAVRGTRLYVATRSTGAQTSGDDHHIFVSDTAPSAEMVPAPWAKRGMVAMPADRPFLAAEGSNAYAGWFNARNATRLHRASTGQGVLEGSLDLVEEFGTVPEFVYLAAVAYETSDASPANADFGRVVAQTPPANIEDDDITADEFLKVPVHSVTDSASDGYYDILVPGRAFTARLHGPGESQPHELRWPVAPGRAYRVSRASRLQPGDWTTVGTIESTPGQWEAAFTGEHAGANGPIFYRIELLGSGD